MQRFANAAGVTYLECLLALTLGTTLTATTIPLAGAAIDDVRTAMAARYVASRIGVARLDALRQSRAVGLRFEPAGRDYQFAPYADGNGNGVRSADIQGGTDPVLGPFERLQDKYPGVRFELGEGVPDADGQGSGSADGVRIGTARILSMSSDGTATSGTLYIRGRRAQYAVRILGITGRTRMLHYNSGNRSWISR